MKHWYLVCLYTCGGEGTLTSHSFAGWALASRWRTWHRIIVMTSISQGAQNKTSEGDHFLHLPPLQGNLSPSGCYHLLWAGDGRREKNGRSLSAPIPHPASTHPKSVNCLWTRSPQSHILIPKSHLLQQLTLDKTFQIISVSCDIQHPLLVNHCLMLRSSYICSLIS